jgi:hypothetical protein
MKPTFTLIAVFVFALSVNSQITITSADMPNADDSVRVSFAADPIDPTLTGANYTWNFSLTPTAQTVQIFVNPLDFTIPYNFIFNPFNTSYGVQQYLPDSIAGFQPDDAYNYLKESSGDLKKVGQGMTINSIPLPMQYTNPDYIYRFPMNYGNMDSCDAYVEITIPGFGTYAQSIHRVNEVDGWGQLTTPFGTVSSLRIKSMVLTRDSIAPEDTTMGGGFAFNRPLAYEYKWFSAGSKIPYLEIDATDLGGGPTVTNIIYQDVYQPGVFQLGVTPTQTDINLKIFPNPATDFIYVQYTLTNNSDLKFEILDITGRIVETIAYPNQPTGPGMQTISLKNLLLSTGTYFVKISGNGFTNSQKFMVK